MKTSPYYDTHVVIGVYRVLGVRVDVKPDRSKLMTLFFTDLGTHVLDFGVGSVFQSYSDVSSLINGSILIRRRRRGQVLSFRGIGSSVRRIRSMRTRRMSF